MKKFKVLMASLVLAAVPFLVQVNAASAADTARTVERLEGANRTLTAIAVAEKGWPNGATTVILTRDDDFPDALAGAPLARMNDAPILLTNSYTLSKETAQEIAKLHPTKIIILGSEGVVSAQIKADLEALYPTVERIGGKDRFDTAAQISQRVGNASGKVVIAYGMNFADALAVSPWAAKNGVPILLSLTDNLTSFTSDALQQLKPSQTIIVGGSGVVSDTVKSALTNPTRYSGANRFETAADIFNRLGVGDGTQLNPSNLFVATGMNWPDALGGSALAGRDGNPIILAGSTLDPKEASYIYNHYAAVTKVTPLGGVDVVSNDVVNEIINGCYNEYLNKTYSNTSFSGTPLTWLDSYVQTGVDPVYGSYLNIAVLSDNAKWNTIKNYSQADLQAYLTTIVTDAQKQYPNLVNNISLTMVTTDGTNFYARAVAYDYAGPIVVEFDPSIPATASASSVKSFDFYRVPRFR